MSAGNVVAFGQFTFDLATLELTHRGRPVPLRPQPSLVLGVLVRNAGRLVSREELRGQLWPDTVVEYEKGLNTAIRQVRDALGERAGAPVFVETVPRRGYRFIAPISRPGASSSPVDDSAVGVAHRSRRRRLSRAVGWGVTALVVAVVAAVSWPAPQQSAVRVLVLPFENLTTDPELDAVAGVLAEEVRGHLVSLDPARVEVIARTTAERQANSGRTIGEMGASLDLDYVLEGSLSASSGSARVIARLVSTEREATIWQESFRVWVGEADAYAARLGARIAGTVAPDVRARAVFQMPGGAGETPSDSAARPAYLKGRFFLARATSASLRRAIEYFEEAIEAAPNHAPAHSGLAEARLWTGDWEGARSAAGQAVTLDPALAEGHRVLGAVRLGRDFDIAGAGASFRRALDLAPGRAEEANAWAYYQFLTGDPDSALATVERIIALDPLSAALNGDVGIFYHWAGRNQRAIEHCRLAAELDSTHVFARRCLVRSLEANGQPELAAGQLARLMALEAAPVDAARAVSARTGAAAVSAYRAWRLAFLETAPQRGWVLLERAQHHAAEGALDDALACLEGAAEDPSFGFVTIAVDPVFAPLRHLPRFQALLDRIGLAAV